MKLQNNVPKNKFGIFACHCEGEQLTKAELRKIINGPIAACEKVYLKEIKKIVFIGV